MTLAIDANDPYEIFMAALQKDATRKAYDWAIGKYLDYCKVDQYSDLLKGETAELESRVQQYILYLNNDKFSNSMRNTRISAVKLFYVMNGKMLNWDRLLRLKRMDSTPKDDHKYTKDDIIKMLRTAKSPRDKAIILILATSGMRIGALPDIKIGDLELLTEPNPRCMAIKVYAGTAEQYLTFITPEATKAVFGYLKTRYKKLTDMPRDDYLITNAYYPEHKTTIQSLSERTREIAINAGVRPFDTDRTARKDIPLNHGFRKFANTVFTKTEGLKTIWADKLLGHKIGIQDHYADVNMQELFDEYRRAIKGLTFDYDNTLVQPSTVGPSNPP